MLAQRNPQEVYRRIDFDARVNAADPRELVAVCYEQLIGALGSSLWAQDHGDNLLKSRSLTRAMAALTALQMGVKGNDAMTDALHHMYTAARHAVLDSVLNFDATTIARVSQDFRDISESLMNAGQTG